MEKNSFSVGLLKGLAEIFVFVCLIVPLVVQAEVVTEIIYGTLTSKSDNIGDVLIATLYWLKFFDYFKLILLFLLYFKQNYWSRCSHNWVFKGMGRTA